MKRIRKVLAVCLLTALLLCVLGQVAGCGTAALYTATYLDVFDTVLTLQVAATDRSSAEDAIREVHDCLLDLHRQFDIYHDWAGVNNLKTINDHAGDGKPIPVTEDVLSLLELGAAAYELSDGRVNICMGSVLSLWHTARETEQLPTEEMLTAAAAHTSPDALCVDEAAGTVRLTDPDARLDVGAVAKGYAAARAAAFLRGRVASGELVGVLMDIGGQVLALGTREDGTPWRVGVRDPRPSDGILYDPPRGEELVSREVKDMTVVTSGVDQRGFTLDGVRYHHLIDPDTLYPATRSLSVTAFVPDYAVFRVGDYTLDATAFADALSTALFLLPPEDGQALLATIPGAYALWVTAEGQVICSDGWGAEP